MVGDLHQAAIVLQAAQRLIAETLAAAEPLERDLHRSIPTGITEDELEGRYQISGYEAFTNACCSLKDLVADPWLRIEKEEGVEAKIAT